MDATKTGRIKGRADPLAQKAGPRQRNQGEGCRRGLCIASEVSLADPAGIAI